MLFNTLYMKQITVEFFVSFILVELGYLNLQWLRCARTRRTACLNRLEQEPGGLDENKEGDVNVTCLCAENHFTTLHLVGA